MKIIGGPVLQVCDENPVGYICKVFRIVTGTQKLLSKCNNEVDYDDDNDGDGDAGVDNDSDHEGPLLQQSRLEWPLVCVSLEARMSRRSRSN